MAGDELAAWQGSLQLHGELSCASCLGPLSRAVSPTTCGHLLCNGCAEELLGTAMARDPEHLRLVRETMARLLCFTLW